MVEDHVFPRISNMNDNADLSRLCKTEALYVPPQKKAYTEEELSAETADIAIVVRAFCFQMSRA